MHGMVTIAPYTWIICLIHIAMMFKQSLAKGTNIISRLKNLDLTEEGRGH